MAVRKNTKMNKFSLAMRKTKSFVGLLAMATQFSKTLLSKRVFALDQTDRSSRRAFSKRPVSLGGETMYMMRRWSLALSGGFEICSRMGHVASPDNAQCWGFWGRSTKGIYSLSRLLVAVFRSSGRDLPWLVHLGMTRVIRLTFWPVMGPTSDKGAVEARNLFIDRTRRCCRRSLRSFHRSVVSQGSCS